MTSPDAHMSGCRSCGVPAGGNFCANCGEATKHHVPSAGEFLHEFVGHHIAFEGKLWTTLRLLVSRPGQLTAEFLRGRRIPYIEPLRLYLTLSVVMFALIKTMGVELPKIALDDSSVAASYTHSLANKDHPNEAVTFRLALSQLQDKPAQGEVASVTFDGDLRIRDAIAAVGRVNARWAGNLARFMNERPAEKAEVLNHGFLANLPTMLICTLPLFALYLKLVYLGSGRRYGEHLVFALHANAFAFLVASVMIVVPGSIGWLIMALFLEGSLAHISAWDCLQALPFLYLAAYLPVAMRRVYGGSRLATCWRWLVLIAAHVLVVAGATLAAEMIGIMGQG
jgi:hypothetical protein